MWHTGQIFSCAAGERDRWDLISCVYLNSEARKTSTASWSWDEQVLKLLLIFSYINQNHSSVKLIISLRCEAKPVYQRNAFQRKKPMNYFYSVIKIYKLIGEDSKNKILFSFCMYFFTLKICILISKAMLKLPSFYKSPSSCLIILLCGTAKSIMLITSYRRASPIWRLIPSTSMPLNMQSCSALPGQWIKTLRSDMSDILAHHQVLSLVLKCYKTDALDLWLSKLSRQDHESPGGLLVCASHGRDLSPAAEILCTVCTYCSVLEIKKPDIFNDSLKNILPSETKL